MSNSATRTRTAAPGGARRPALWGSRLLAVALLLLKLAGDCQTGASAALHLANNNNNNNRQPVRADQLGEVVADLLAARAASNNANANNNNDEGRVGRLVGANWRPRRHASAGLGAELRALASGEAEARRLARLQLQQQQQQQQQQPAGLSQLPLLLQNQQSLEDEQAVRQQLPELLAQAHNDKTAERALLRMLINVSLRSALSNMVGPAASAAAPVQAQATPGWLDGLASAAAADGAGAIGERLARLEQQQQLQQQNELIGDSLALANGDSASLAGLAEAQPFGQSANLMDKREYIKPCSFNAISCVRTPFRKL